MLLVISVCNVLGAGARSSRCYFPDDWKGQYFQSGLGNVIIRKSVVTTKGTCVDQHRDYFLFANRSPQNVLLIYFMLPLAKDRGVKILKKHRCREFLL